jgi:hypothetical protein
VFVTLSMEGWWALSMSASGTPERWCVRAFTQGNGLPWNAQTRFDCQCATEQAYDSTNVQNMQGFLCQMAARP